MLRNKYFIAAIGGLMLLVLIYNIAFFSGRGKGSDQKSSVIPGAAVQDDAGRISAASAHSQKDSLTGEWRRDPFWYPQNTKHAAPGRPATASHPSSGIRLEATMVRDGKGYAIISGQLVGVGERFREYVVAEIGDLFVKLKGPSGMKKLSITIDTNVKE